MVFAGLGHMWWKIRPHSACEKKNSFFFFSMNTGTPHWFSETLGLACIVYQPLKHACRMEVKLRIQQPWLASCEGCCGVQKHNPAGVWQTSFHFTAGVDISLTICLLAFDKLFLSSETKEQKICPQLPVVLNLKVELTPSSWLECIWILCTNCPLPFSSLLPKLKI